MTQPGAPPLKPFTLNPTQLPGSDLRVITEALFLRNITAFINDPYGCAPLLRHPAAAAEIDCKTIAKGFRTFT